MTGPWWRVAIRCRAEDRDAVAAFLVGMTGQGVEEAADGLIHTVAESREEAGVLIAEVAAAYRNIQAYDESAGPGRLAGALARRDHHPEVRAVDRHSDLAARDRAGVAKWW